MDTVVPSTRSRNRGGPIGRLPTFNHRRFVFGFERDTRVTPRRYTIRFHFRFSLHLPPPGEGALYTLFHMHMCIRTTFECVYGDGSVVSFYLLDLSRSSKRDAN